jgi:hypothetical protein
MSDDAPIEYELARSGALFDDLDIIDTKIVPTAGDEDWAVTIE